MGPALNLSNGNDLSSVFFDLICAGVYNIEIIKLIRNEYKSSLPYETSAKGKVRARGGEYMTRWQTLNSSTL
jgi:hypothetical protein